MVEAEEEVSPASIPSRATISWSTTIKATNTTILSDDEVQFEQSGGFRYCRSDEEFSSGSHRFGITVDWGGKDGQISFGVAYAPNLSCDAGVYYFTDAYIYCNYYPSFTKDYNNIHKTAPVKVKEGQEIFVNFDFDSRKLFWEIDGKEYEELDFNTNGRPCYIVAGMFSGKAKFI
mmetsp:Transcript_13794/g.14348  ORF Transcript_13794/g.14348 Transcript_13794/m.14348 type:complete len:175 (+) Transcript_13794:6-530(+)